MPRTDFSTWQRETLERFARDAAEEIRELRADVRAALDGLRTEIREQLPQKKNEEN